MEASGQNLVCLQAAWGLFVGRFDDNRLHKHYAVQISLAAGSSTFNLIDGSGNGREMQHCLIPLNIPHRLVCPDVHLTLLINPVSAVGHSLSALPSPDLAGDPELLSPMRDWLQAFLADQLSFPDLVTRIGDHLEGYACTCDPGAHRPDERISKAVRYLEAHFDRVVPLAEVAEYCHLSPSRFLHLFRERTRISFRRYQLWNKLMKSIPHLHEHSITGTAHRFGFTDSAHYTRTFRESFGLSPKALSQFSRFIQV